jgi:hypothetical protein
MNRHALFTVMIETKGRFIEGLTADMLRGDMEVVLHEMVTRAVLQELQVPPVRWSKILTYSAPLSLMECTKT